MFGTQDDDCDGQSRRILLKGQIAIGRDENVEFRRRVHIRGVYPSPAGRTALQGDAGIRLDAEHRFLLEPSPTSAIRR